MITARDLTIDELRSRARVSMAYHAVQRLWERRVSEREVLLTLVTPRWIEPNSPGHPIDRAVYCNGRIRVVLALATRTVITIEIEGLHDYDPDTYVRAAPPPGPGRCVHAKTANYSGTIAA